MDLLTKFNIKILQSLFWSRKKEEKENFKKKKIREGAIKDYIFITLKLEKIRPTHIGMPLLIIHKISVANTTEGAATESGSNRSKAYPARVAASDEEIVGVIVVKR